MIFNQEQMKAKLIFDLEDPNDRIEFERAIRGKDMAMLLWEYDQHLRSEYKYGEKEEAYAFREKLREMMTEAGIDLDLLM